MLKRSFELMEANPDSAFTLADEVRNKSIAGGYREQEANSLRKLALVYKNWGDFEQAMTLSTKALSICDAINDERGRASTLALIGNIQARLKNHKKAIGYFLEARNIREQRNETAKVLGLDINLGIAYKNLGALDSAELVYKRVLEQAGNIQSTDQMIEALINMGNLYAMQGRMEEAKSAFLRSISYSNKDGSLLNLAKANTNMGVFYFNSGNLDSTQHYLLRSKSMYESLNAKASLANVLFNLAVLKADMSQYDSAYAYLMESMELNEELFSESKELSARSIEARYKVQKNELEKKQLEAALIQKRQIMWVLALAVAIIGLSGGFLVYRQRQKTIIALKNEELKQREIDELLQRQELTSINAMMEGQEQERQRIAQDLHDRIGSQLAAVKLNMEALEDKVDKGQSQNKGQFAKTYGMLDHLVDEVRKISHNMVSGVLMKFGLEVALRDLAASISTSGRIRVDVHTYNLHNRIAGKIELAVYRIIQELLANVLKHAQAQHITVSLNRQDGNLNVMVEDDGRGFDPERVKRGMGLQNVQQRAEALNGTVNIDAKAGRGTTIIVDIPVT